MIQIDINMPIGCIYEGDNGKTEYCPLCNHDDVPYCQYLDDDEATLGIDERPCYCPLYKSEPQWIPVSERLPEICEKDVSGMVTFSKQVWACRKYGDGFLWQAIDQYSSFGSWLSEIPIDDPRERCEVVAWMPLPEPWGGDSDD